MYRVIGNVASRSFRVLWMLEELGLPYEHVNAGPRSDEVFTYSAQGKIPVLVDGDTPVTDSTAIITYLADKHGQFTAASGTCLLYTSPSPRD